MYFFHTSVDDFLAPHLMRQRPRPFDAMETTVPVPDEGKYEVDKEDLSRATSKKPLAQLQKEAAEKARAEAEV